MYFDEHNYELSIKDLKEASAIDDRNLKVRCHHLFSSFREIYFLLLGTNDVSKCLFKF